MRVKKITYKMKKALSETVGSLQVGVPVFIDGADFSIISVRTAIERLKLKGLDFQLLNCNGGSLITRIK